MSLSARAVARKLAQHLKDQLISRALERRLDKAQKASRELAASADEAPIPEAHYRFEDHPSYRQLQILRDGAQRFHIESPFFYVHEGIASASTRLGEHSYINFAHYNYLDLVGHTDVQRAARDALERYGTSVSASRIVAGERALHKGLESALAQFYGVADALVFVSGHATNVSSIGHLLGPKDLILHDEYVHNSVLVGAQLSRARRFSFPHNDLGALERLLSQHRPGAERTLIAVEGLYSMDGDLPDLPGLLALKNRFKAWLMVDEAHSLGVLGASGRGLAEHFGVDPRLVDIWMGTLSKTLASCGGYIAGSCALVDILRHFAPGFLYSVGLPPPQTAAALAALEVLRKEPERVARLHQNSLSLVKGLQEAGLDIGASSGHAVVPLIMGGSLPSIRLARALLERGIHVQPILYPAVPERRARLRFFVNAAHSAEDIETTVRAVIDASQA